MTPSVRVTRIAVLAFGVLAAAAGCWPQNRSPKAEKLAKTYGLDSWGQIEAIRYTFNLQVPALKLNLSRSWEWEPKTGKVSYESKDKDGKPIRVSYTRFQPNEPDSVRKEVEPAFVNDNYWLLFPLHAYWDTSADVTDEGMHKLPTGKGSAELVSVKYGAQLGGYTPGDTWGLYVGKDGRVEYLSFHHGGKAKPSVVLATWAGYKKAGPLLISTEHRGAADGAPLHLFLSNVSVKLAGSDAWVNAQ
jgi:hypothetical protein